MNNQRKVALIQNRIQPGGRLHVMIATIKTLNDIGIEPDIITLKSRISKQDIINKFGKNIRFNLKEILYDIRIPFEFHILLFNYICKFFLKKYDLIINSNNTSFLLPQKINLLSYTHYPRKARLLSKKVSIHFPDGPDKSWLNPYHVFLNFAALLYRSNFGLNKNETVIANSLFTKEAIQANYLKSKIPIIIIYPPVAVEKNSQNNIKKKSVFNVVSIGRFAPDKRQLEQIEIAAILPDYTFHIIGFADDKNKYYENCMKFIDKNKISNAILHRNIDYNKLQSLLKISLFFIHNLRNEPFGITAVQAISQGCIPVVHNSGGQKEIVNIEELRYKNKVEAAQIFNAISKYSSEKLINIQNKLLKNINRFDESMFYKEMKKLLSKHLSNIQGK
jgi:glycosyltransferase involved in cell wall biosynthesis